MKVINPIMGHINRFKAMSIEEMDKVEGYDRVLRFRCNHRSEDGLQDELVQDPNTGVLTCNICKRRFSWLNADEYNANDIDEKIVYIIDVIESIRAMGIAKEGFIEKYDTLFESVEFLDRLSSIYLEALEIFKEEEKKVLTHGSELMKSTPHLLYTKGKTE